MNPDTIRDHLLRADMNDAQAHALSQIFAEMATKSDLVQFEERMRANLSELRADMISKMIAIVGFFATASTLLNLFVG